MLPALHAAIMSIHRQVLNSLDAERVWIEQKEYRFQVEQPGWRFDLPVKTSHQPRKNYS
jgi:hypothetical protein